MVKKFRQITPTSIPLDEDIYRLYMDGLGYLHDLSSHDLPQSEPPRFEKTDLAHRVATVVDELIETGAEPLATAIRKNYDTINDLAEDQEALAEFVEALVDYYSELLRYRKTHRNSKSTSPNQKYFDQHYYNNDCFSQDAMRHIAFFKY